MSEVFVSTVLVPVGLIAVMFSLGLSLAVQDFKRLASAPKPVLAGLFGQLILLPLLAFTVVTLLQLPPMLAVSMMIVAACPGGVTSNAVVFIMRGDVALSDTSTALSSLVTVFSTPFIIGLALVHFYSHGTAPQIAPLQIMKALFIMTVLPVTAGMVLRHFKEEAADKLITYLKPASMIVLFSVIIFSLVVGYEKTIHNLAIIAPASLILNVIAMLIGFGLATLLKLPTDQKITLSVEVGVQNATMAIFLTLVVLKDIELASGANIYGVIMLINAMLFVRLLRYWQQRSAT
ncbi:MAG: bile acid:sodium symporter family protein [Kordiimonadaceae bacterium]|nr:bile acid:sodium symporter family protein [Kordiimonadaceae bacterium]